MLSKELTFILSCRSGTWQYAMGNGSGWYGLTGADPWYSTGIAQVPGQWQHVAVTRTGSGGAINFYLNGALANTRTAQSLPLGNSTSYYFYIGARTGPSNAFDGSLDEVRVYSVDRSASIATDMNTYGPTSTSGLIAYYDFNEGPVNGTGTGTVINRASGAVSSTNLLLVNSPTYVDIKQTSSNGSNTVVTFPRSYLTTAGGWRIPQSVTSLAQVLTVAGGGSGGSGRGGGGGGGGVTLDSNVAVSAGSVTQVVVGMGGLGNTSSGNNGGNSSFGTLTAAVGGGKGGVGLGGAGQSGGSGGGGGGNYATYSTSGGSATSGQGYAGAGSGNNGTDDPRNSGGGGGAGAAGTAGTGTSTPPNGGAGRSVSITGVAVSYGGGGGGSSGNAAGEAYSTAGQGSGGAGGGGAGGAAGAAGSPGSNGLGGGGGGGGTGPTPTWVSYKGGDGGSGVVIVSYASSSACAPTSSSYVSGGVSYRALVFADPGSCTWTVPNGVTSVDAVLVGGGGGGGGSIGGGGGAGEFKSRTGVAVTAGSTQTITVGSGGTPGIGGVGSGGSGGTTTALTYSVKGGGGGATLQYAAVAGGSGGGGLSCGYVVSAAGGGTSASDTGLVNSGGTGSTVGAANCVAGGGGGAGAVGGTYSGQSGGAGGAGTTTTITGTTIYLAGGGGGGINGNTGALSSGTAGAGGSGIGGAGGSKQVSASDPNNLDGRPGLPGTGSGGGGASNSTYGGPGGSGTVILRYALTATTTCSSPSTTSTTDGYIVTAFKNSGSCTWTAPPGVTNVDYLVVAGGGGGGNGRGGGGGAGGMRNSSLSVTPGTSYTVTVGAGGAGATSNGAGANGSSSVFSSITSAGGGGGGGWTDTTTGSGGSGGGAPVAGAALTTINSGGSATPSGQGNAGGSNGPVTNCNVSLTNQSCTAGGGGGAGAAGSAGTATVGGSGGIGSTVSWLTSSLATTLGVGHVSSGSAYFAGGGGGGASGYVAPALIGGAGGIGGGGAGNAAKDGTATAGTANTGGGGGGAEGATGYGGTGGSGVVVIRYAQPSCSPQTSYYSTFAVVEFVGAGSCSWTPPSGVTVADVLAVGGGGGGGSRIGGGGGGGGVVPSTDLTLAGTAVTVTVGAGGAGATASSSASTSAGGIGGSSSFGSVTALGGGGGGSDASFVATSGATGGGVGFPNACPGTAGTGTSGAGAAGGTCTFPANTWVYAGGGGGGGATGVAGSNGESITLSAGAGGSGTASSISGTSTYYGGGGGGGLHTSTYGNLMPGLGGRGGGGAGAAMVSGAGYVGAAGNAGQDGLGGGGGGASVSNGWAAAAVGGKGGDGTVIVSYSIVPNEPTSVTSTASAVTSATVSWTAPTHDGGSAITGYTVQVSAAGGAYANAAAGTCNTAAPTSTATSCTVTGLTAGTAYTFKVNAINANGAGTQSSATSSLTAYGALDHFAVTNTSDAAVGTQTAGTSFDVKITAQDSGNRTVTNFTGTVDLTSTSLISSGTSTTTASFTSGVLSSHAVTLLRAGSSQTVTATRSTGGSEAGTSGSFTINAGTAAKLQVLLPGETAAPGTTSGKTGTPTGQTAGTALTVTVNAVDANWNVVSSSTPTVAITSSDSAATLPSNAALVSGAKDFSVTLKTAGTATITATDQAGSPFTASTSASVSVSAASASKLVVASIGSQTAGTSFSVTATLTDAYGNSVNNTGATGTVTLTRTSGSGTLGGTTTGTIVVGSSAVTISGVTYSKAESGVVLTATGTGASSLVNGKTGASASFTVASGTATGYSVTLSSSTPTVGGTVTVTAQLQDSNGNDVATSGKTVTWSASGTGGSFSSATSTTNASGTATVTYTVPTTSAAARTITGTDNTSLTGTSSALTTQVGTASAARSILTASSSSVTADGSTVTLTVTAKDQYGNTLSAGGSTVVISRASGTGTVGSVTDNGDGTYIATLTSPTTTGSGVFSATLGGSAVQGGTGSTQTVTITYNPGAATRLVVTGSASQTAGTTQNLTITAMDANGNTDTSYTGDKAITFTGATSLGSYIPTVTDKTGTSVSFGSAATITFTSGVATVSSGGNGVMTLYKAEAATVVASDGSISSSGSDRLGVTVSAAADSALAMVTQPVAAASGALLSTQPVVKIVDAYGNTTTSTATVTVTASGGTLGGTQASSGLAAVSGEANFTNLTFSGLTTTSRNLTFASSGLTSVTSASITPTGPGTAASLVITGSSSQTAGGTQSVTITAKDAAGNTATGYTGDKSITFSGASSSPGGTAPTVTSKTGSAVSFGSATTITFTNGVATVSSSSNGVMSLYKAESATVSVSDGSISSSGSDRLSVTVSAASANQLAMATEPVAGTSGSSLSTQPVVYVRDAYGNATTSTATVTVTASGGTLGGSEATSGKAAVLGTATFTNLTFAGLTTTTYTLTFASSGLTSVTSATITPSGAGSAASLAITGTASQLAGVTQNLTITAKDAAGNTATGYSGDKSLTFSGAANSPDGTIPSVVNKTGSTISFGAATTITFVSGVATVSSSMNGVMRLYKAQTATVSVTDGTLVSTGAGDLAVTVTAAAASKVFTLQEPVGGASGALLATQPQAAIADAYGNTVTSSTATITASVQGSGSWANTSGLPSASWQDVAYGNGLWVAVGSAGEIATSSDGISWTAQSSPASSLRSVAYASGYWIAAGTNWIIRSSDGVTWSNITPTPAADYRAVGYSSFTGFVVITNTGLASRRGGPVSSWATDNLLATTNTPSPQGSWTALAEGNGVMLGLDSGQPGNGTTRVMILTGGTSTGLPDGTWNDLTYGNSTWVAVGNSTVATSSNGVTWTSRTIPSGQWKSVAFADGEFRAVASGSSNVATSTDGITWTTSAALTSSTWKAIASGGGRWVAVSQSGLGQYWSSGLGGTVDFPAVAGVATWTDLTYSGTSGVNKYLTLSSSGLTSATSAAFSVTPGTASASSSTVSAASSSLTAGGSGTTITVQAKDSSGNTISSGGATVTMSTTLGSLGSVTDNGNGTYTATLSPGTTPGTATVSATIGGTTLSSSTAVTVSAGAASALTLSRSAVGTASGAVFTTVPQVSVTDSSGNVLTSDVSTVVTASISAGGTLVGTTTATVSAGVATFTGLGITGTAGTQYTITFASGSLTSATQQITVTVGAAATIAVNAGDGQSATAGSAVATAPSVLVTDSGGNPVSGRSVTFAAASGGGLVVGGSATTNSSGIAAVTSWTLGTTAGANTLTATSSGLAGSPVTFTATGVAGTVTQFAVTMSGGTTALSAAAKAAGTPFSVRVTAQDANGNTNASWTGSVSLTSTSWTGTVTADISANGYVDGVAVTPTIAGTSRRVTAASGAITTALASSTFTVNPGAQSSFTITDTAGGAIATQVAGNSFVIMIKAVDSYGNTVTSFTGTTTLTSSRGTVLTGSTTSSFSAGVLSSHFLSVSASGSQRITASSTGPTVTGMSASFTVTAGAVSKLVLNTTPSSSSASGTVLGRQPVLFEQDAYSNVSTNGPINVSAIVSSTVESITGIHSGYPIGLTYGGGRWVLAAACDGYTSRTCIYLSADGASWSQVLATLSETPWAAGYGGGAWLVTTESGAYRSTDGLTWTRGSTALSTWTQKAVAYGNGVWVSVGSNVSWRSTDGGNQWSTITGLNNRMLESVIYADGMFLASGSGGTFSSANGTSWTQLSSAQRWLAYGAGVYVSAGYTQSGSTVRVAISYSTNPSAGWTEVRSVQSIDCAPRAVAWSGTQFVVGGNGCFFTSTDGINWSGGASQTAPPMTVAAGGNGMVLSSYQPSQLNRIYDSIAGTTTVTPSSGTATFTDLAISGPVGTTRTLSYLGSTSTGAGGSAWPLTPAPSSSSVTITAAGPAYRLLLTRASVGTASGAAFTTQPQITVADMAGNTRTSDNSTVVTATASSSGSIVGTATATAVNGVVTFTDLGLSGTAGSAYEITYSSGSLAAASQIITVTRASQTVTFGAGPGTLTYGDAPFTVSATSTSGGAVTFSSLTSSVCSVSGPTVTIITAGTCTIRGSVAQTASYNAATADQSYTINQAAQAALTLTSTSGTFGTSLTLATSGGTTAGAVTYGVASGTASGCTITSGALSSTSAGTCVVTATMAGNTNYTAVTSSATTVNLATRPITITAADKAIVFGASLSESYSLTTGSLASSDAIGSLTYTYAGTGSTSYGPSSTKPTGAGTYSVTPSAAVFSSGSASNYDIQYAAGTVTIGQASQTITFANPAPTGATYLDPAIPVSPTSSSGLAVTLTSADTSVCQVSSSAVTIVGAGTCSITASQSGSADYSAATSVTRSFTVSPANQAALSITSPSTAIYGESITLAASGGSGTGALVFGVTAGTCTVSGTTLTLGDASSTCRVQATKVSDANYNATTSSVQTITISRAGQVVSFTSSVPASPLPNGTYTPTASSISTVTGASSGLTPTFSIRGSSSSVCSISGGVVTFLATGACIVDADSGLTTNFTAASTASQTISVGSLNQNITFAQPANVSFGTSSASMGATASSGLTVTYSLGSGTTNSACTVSSLGVVTILAVGTCEVTAAQSGDSQYAAASTVTRAFQVVASLASAPHLASASAGDQAVTVAFSSPGFTGGVAISAYRIVATPVVSGTTVTTTACTASPCTITGLANGTAYTVTVAAINSAGTGTASSASTALTPATAAFAVSDLAAVAGDTLVTVTWTSLTVAQLGGGTFTRYEVYSRVAGTSSWSLWSNALTSRTDHSSTVTGLSNGTSYDFRVVAITSANGSQIAGNTAEVVQYPSTTPSAPRSLTTLAATATDIQVSWQAPLSDGGAALISPYYSVSITSTTPGATSPVTCTFASVADRFCTASNLTNGAVYSVSAGAINRMGTGALATASYSVPSSDATLSALEVTGSAGALALSPAFASGTNAYAAEVGNAVSSVTVTATTTMAGSTMTIEGAVETSGVASAAIPLAVGPTTITVVVTASDTRFTETYEIEVTRAAATGGGGGSWVPSLDVVVPATTLVSGATVGAVIEAGAQVPTVLSRNDSDSGWLGVGEGFSFSVSTRTPSGAPESMTPAGVMRVPAGGSVVISGDGYLPESTVAVFAVPRTQARSDAAAVMRLLGGRADSGAVYLGSANANANGVVNDVISIPASISAGDYVLQINGYTIASQVRSLNLAVNVVAVQRTLMVSKALEYKAFYQGGKDRFTVEGVDKMREIAKSVPKDARNVKVKITGVSVGLGSVTENVELAAKRAQRISDYLVAKGIQGDYEISFTTSFTVGGDRDGVTDKAEKPLTTVAISYDLPVTSS